jgi:hypothetical protein
VLVKREVCGYRDQFPVASQQNITNHFSLLWDKPISQQCIGDICSEKYKRKNLAIANIKKVKSAKHDKLEEALLIWIEQLHTKSGSNR